MKKAAIISFFNGLGDTVLLIPILRLLDEKYEKLLIFTHINSKPLLTEFERVHFIENYNDNIILGFDFTSTGYQWTYFDFNITYNPLKDLIKKNYDPELTFDYQKVQNSSLKDVYETNNMFFKQFIQAGIWPMPDKIDRRPYIPESYNGFYNETLKIKKGIITIHTDTDHKKQWNINSWYTLIAFLEENFPQYQIVIVGFPDPILKKNGIILAPDLYACLEAIRISSVFVGIDSVFSHVADAFNTKGVVLFNHINHKDWKPSENNLSFLISSNKDFVDISVIDVLDHVCTCIDSTIHAGDLLKIMYSKDYRLIEKAPFDILQDHELITSIIEECPFIYPYINENLKRVPEIIQLTVSSFWYLLSFVPEDCRTDEICLLALAQNGWALDFINKELKKNREIVEVAVTNKGDALEFAPEHFKSERDLVLKAVKENGLALRYADPKLRADKEILRFALLNNPFAIEFAPVEIRNSPEWIEFCEKQCPDVKYLLNKLQDNAF